MKTLKNDQAGIGHIILIVAFLVLFAGIGAFAYTRVNEANDKKQATANSSSQVANKDDDTENANADDKVSLPDNDDQADPSDTLEEGTY